MSIFISSKCVQRMRCNEFAADASELRWPPGFFPDIVATDLGNAQPLVKVQQSPQCVKYAQLSGETFLVVYND